MNDATSQFSYHYHSFSVTVVHENNGHKGFSFHPRFLAFIATHLQSNQMGAQKGAEVKVAHWRCPQMKLTDLKCKSAQPSKKSVKMADGRGMYLEIMPNIGAPIQV